MRMLCGWQHQTSRSSRWHSRFLCCRSKVQILIRRPSILGYSWFSSVPPSSCWDLTLDNTASFNLHSHLMSHQSFCHSTLYSLGNCQRHEFLKTKQKPTQYLTLNINLFYTLYNIQFHAAIPDHQQRNSGADHPATYNTQYFDRSIITLSIISSTRLHNPRMGHSPKTYENPSFKICLSVPT